MVDIETLADHPRLKELELILKYDALAAEFTPLKASQFFQNLCESFSIDWPKINSVLAQSNTIKRDSKGRTDLVKYRQQVLVMGTLKGESKYVIAKKYLRISEANLYRPQFKPEEFLTEEWVEDLNDSVKVCGVETYANAVITLLGVLDRMLEAFGRVLIPKT